jgi:Skp family chaperone for outer membrane proteins
MPGDLARETATPSGQRHGPGDRGQNDDATAVLALQRSAGNAAVSRLLQRMVVNADPGDKVIDDAVTKLVGRPLAKDTPGGKGQAAPKTAAAPHGDVVKWKHAKFSHLARSTEPIIIVGHGEDTLTEGMIRARRFGHLTPQEIVEGLVDKGLPTSYEGLIYLDGCYTGAGDVKNFTQRVAEGLRKAGYLSVTVKGNLGAAATEAQGVEKVQFAEHERAWAELQKTKTFKKYKREKNKLEKRRKELSDKMAAIVKGKSHSALTDAEKKRSAALNKEYGDIGAAFDQKWSQAYRDEVRTLEKRAEERFDELVSVVHPEKVPWATSPLYEPPN